MASRGGRGTIAAPSASSVDANGPVADEEASVASSSQDSTAKSTSAAGAPK